MIMTLKPYAEAQSSIRKGLVDVGDAREYSWAGDNTYMLHNLLSDDQLVQVVIVSSDKVKETESSEQWSRTVTADEMQNLFRGWTPHLTQAIDEVSRSTLICFSYVGPRLVLTAHVHKLYCKQPEHHAMYLWEYPHARSYVSGPMCIIGDAAHAMTA